MEQIKIGRFIAERRKQCGLTQLQLAERLNITDRAVSKWETGRSMPDVSIIPELCDVLGITVNDLFSGEVITVDHYNEQSEKNLLELAKQKEESDRRMLAMEIVIGALSVFILLSMCMIAAYLPMEDWLRILLILGGLIPCLVGVCFGLRIEQKAGYYACAKCGHRHVPRFGSVLMAMHFGRTRYMKCPKCGKLSWQKKVLSKEKDSE